MTHIDKLRELAELACPLPWEKSSADVPYSAKAALQGALSPDVVVRLLDVVQAVQTLAHNTDPAADERSRTGMMLAALRAALDALEKMDGPLPEKVQLIQEDE